MSNTLELNIDYELAAFGEVVSYSATQQDGYGNIVTILTSVNAIVDRSTRLVTTAAGKVETSRALLVTDADTAAFVSDCVWLDGKLFKIIRVDTYPSHVEIFLG